MPDAFDRVTELYVGTFSDGNSVEGGYKLESLHFDFDITRSVEFYKDKAVFNIYNPNRQTITEIMSTGRSVVFKAGYKNQRVGTIFIGQIAKAYQTREITGDVCMHLICNAQRGAQYQLSRLYIGISFPVGSCLYDILKQIADYAGLPLSGANDLKSKFLDVSDGPYHDCGTIRDVCENLMARKLRAIGGKLCVTNNELIYINMSGKTVFDTALLTFNSGLISARITRDDKYQSSEDAFMENQAYYLGLSSSGDSEVAKKNADEEKIPQVNEVEFECLIHPEINVNAPVKVDARISDDDKESVYGKFWPQSINYKGDNYGGKFSMRVVAMEKVTK